MKIQLPQISEMLQINVKLIPLSKEMLPRFDSPLLWCFRQQPTRCQTTKQLNNQTNNNNKTANKPLGAINIPELCELLVH